MVFKKDEGSGFFLGVTSQTIPKKQFLLSFQKLPMRFTDDDIQQKLQFRMLNVETIISGSLQSLVSRHPRIAVYWHFVSFFSSNGRGILCVCVCQVMDVVAWNLTLIMGINWSGSFSFSPSCITFHCIVVLNRFRFLKCINLFCNLRT